MTSIFTRCISATYRLGVAWALVSSTAMAQTTTNGTTANQTSGVRNGVRNSVRNSVQTSGVRNSVQTSGVRNSAQTSGVRNSANRTSGETATNQPSSVETTEARFRVGISAGVGRLTWAGETGVCKGVDLRLGSRISDEFAVYMQPQFALIGREWETQGALLGTSMLTEFTLLNRLFIAGGLGYATLNSAAGTELHGRLGGYPLVGRHNNGPRRRGLMFGADFRVHFVASKTVFATTLSIGYEVL